MSDNNSKKIYFNIEDVFSKVSEILERNGLQETPLNAALKEGDSFLKIILGLTMDFVALKISEKDFSTSIQNRLGVTAETAQNIIKDLKEKIIPFAEKDTLNEQITEEMAAPSAPLPPIEKTQTKKNPKIDEANDKKIKPLDNNTPRTGPDNYREPIE